MCIGITNYKIVLNVWLIHIDVFACQMRSGSGTSLYLQIHMHAPIHTY